MHKWIVLKQFYINNKTAPTCSDVVTPPSGSALLVLASKHGVATGGGLGGVQTPPPEIPNALQNRAKLNPIVKAVKNCWI